MLKPPEDVSVGEVLRFLQKKVETRAVRTDTPSEASEAGSEENPALDQLWLKVKAAVYGIYDDTSMKDLLDENTAMEE